MPWHRYMCDALAPVHVRCPGTGTCSMPWHPVMFDALAPVHVRCPGTRADMFGALAPGYVAPGHVRTPGTRSKICSIPWHSPCVLNTRVPNPHAQLHHPLINA